MTPTTTVPMAAVDIVDAVTRREFLGLVAACSDDDESGEFYKPGSFSYRGQNEDTAELMRRIGLTGVGPDDSVNEESLDDLERLFLS